MRGPKWSDVIAESIEARIDSFDTAEVGWVTTFDVDNLTCSAQPSMAKGYIHEDGERKLATKPPIRFARVAYPGGIVFRLNPGDPVLIVYTSVALDNWSPDKMKVVDPGDDRRNTPSDAFVIPLGKVSEKPAANEVIVEYDKVKLGKEAVGRTRSKVVTLNAISNRLTILDGLINAATFPIPNPTVLTPLLAERVMLGGSPASPYPGSPIVNLGAITVDLGSSVNSETEAT